MVNKEAKLEHRSDFPDLVLDQLSTAKPVMIIDGNVDDQITVDGELISTIDLLVQRAVEGKKYDFVMIYNAATKDIVFGDEYIDLPAKDLGMKEDFVGLEIMISSDSQNGGNLVAMLFDPKVTKAHSNAEYDNGFFGIVRELIRKYTGKTFLIIIDHADDILPDQDHTHTGASHAPLPSQLEDLVRSLKKGGIDRHIIAVDNKGRIAGSLKSSLPSMSVPHSTESEVREILERSISDPQKLIQATRFAVTLEIDLLLSLVDKAGDDIDKLLSSLIKLRTEKIEKMSGGNLTATISWKTDEVALSPTAKRYCDDLAENFFSSPGLVSNGVLLAGPPGTGKSVYPQYVAARVGVPFLRMGSLGTDGLADRGTQKLEQVFAAIEANKPCIVLIDEIDMLMPSGNGDYGSDNNNKFRALFQAKIADDAAMSGVLFFGATNHPDNIPTPMTRSGRFGDIIAVLPPQGLSEKMQVFKAVWNQLKNSGAIPNSSAFRMENEESLAELLNDLPPYITGGDFKQMIIDAVKMVKRRGSSHASILHALFELKHRLVGGGYIKKGVEFDAMVEAALRRQTVGDDDLDDSNEASTTSNFSDNELRAIALSREAARMVDEQVTIARAQDAAREGLRRLSAERAQIERMFDIGLRNLGENERQLAERSRTLQARDRLIRMEEHRIQKESEALNTRAEAQRAVLRQVIGEHRGATLNEDKRNLDEVERLVGGIEAYDTRTTENINKVLVKIDGLLRRVDQLKITTYGILVGNERVENVEKALLKERKRLQDLQRSMTAPAQAQHDPLPDMPQPNMSHPLQPKSRPPRRPNPLPDHSASPRSTLDPASKTKKVSKFTRGRIAAALITLGSIGALVYYRKPVKKYKPVEVQIPIQRSPVQTNEQKPSNEKDSPSTGVIHFNTVEEALASKYLKVENGKLTPIDGYAWVYTEEESSKFSSDDPRHYSIKKDKDSNKVTAEDLL